MAHDDAEERFTHVLSEIQSQLMVNFAAGELVEVTAPAEWTGGAKVIHNRFGSPAVVSTLSQGEFFTITLRVRR